MKNNKKISVPNWLQNELFEKTKVYIELLIELHKKENIGFSKFSLDNIALHSAVMGYYHANPNPTEEKTKSLPDIMRENERLNKTVNDLLETGSSKLSIKQRQELESENEELKKGIKYAEKVAFDTSKQNADLMVKCETYKKDYDSMVAEVVKLSGEKSELLEALSNLIKVSEESTKDIVAFENADILDNCIDKAKAVITK